MELVAEELMFTHPPGPFEHTRSRPAVDRVSFAVAAGTVLGIMGACGSGKTTLLQLLAGTLTPDSGRVSLVRVKPDGEQDPCDAENNGPSDCHGATAPIAMLFQRSEAQFFAPSVREELAYGPAAIGLRGANLEARIRWAAGLTGVPQPWLDRSPFAMSGGEARRVALASIVALAPKFLLLDEPTRGLDAAGVRSVRGAIVKVSRQGCGVVLVSHSADEIAELANTVLVLQEGRAVVLGPTEQVLGLSDQLLAARLEAPTAARLVRALAESGITVPPGRLDSRSVAERIAEAWRLRSGTHGPVQVEPVHGIPVHGAGNHPASRPGGDEFMRPARTIEGSGPTAAGELDKAGRLDSLALTNLIDDEAFSSIRELPWLARLDPRMAIGALACFAWAAFSIRGIAGVMMGAVVAWGACRAAGMTANALWRAVRPAVPLLLFAASLSIMTSQEGPRVVQWLPVTQVGLREASWMLSRLALVTTAAAACSWVTTPLAVADALDWLLAPVRFVGWRTTDWGLGIAIAYRFFPGLWEEARRIQLAQAARSGDAGGRLRYRPFRIVAMIVPLVLAAYRRADALTLAILARGYGRHGPRTPLRRLRIGLREALVAGVVALMVVVSVLEW